VSLFKKSYKKNFVFLKNNQSCLKKKNFVFKNTSIFITPSFIGKKLFLYNGSENCLILIRENMVGFKLGEFILTRKAFKFPKKKNK
jgi:ribosomal protein S19